MSRVTILLAVLSMAGAIGCRKGEPPIPQQVRVQVTDHGFVPAVATVKQDRPVDLVLVRTTNASCAKEVLLPDSGIRRELPLNRPVVIEFTPTREGQVEFVCATGQFSGKVVVEPGT